MKSITKITLAILVFALVSPILTSCSNDKGCTDPVALNFDKKADKDDGSCIYPTPTPPQTSNQSSVTLQFDHQFNGASVTSANFNTIQYTNAFGNQLSISKLRYLISNVKFHRGHPHHDVVSTTGYKLIDLTVPGSTIFQINEPMSKGEYEGISFTIGFIAADNISNFYTDLNAATWNWPAMLGGGYHYMQLEGQFINSSSATVNYAFHYGTAREITATNDTIFHPNFGTADLSNTAFQFTADAAEVHLFVNIDEWFKNPNTWDLNQFSTALMPNFQAQTMMQQNAASVFVLDHVHN